MSGGFTTNDRNVHIYFRMAALEYNSYFSLGGPNFVVNTGIAACGSSSAIWNMSTSLVFAQGPKKTTENLNRVRFK
jgi:hypothetical protein